jgi:hypothetical protein
MTATTEEYQNDRAHEYIKKLCLASINPKITYRNCHLCFYLDIEKKIAQQHISNYT